MRGESAAAICPVLYGGCRCSRHDLVWRRNPCPRRRCCAVVEDGGSTFATRNRMSSTSGGSRVVEAGTTAEIAAIAVSGGVSEAWEVLRRWGQRTVADQEMSQRKRVLEGTKKVVVLGAEIIIHQLNIKTMSSTWVNMLSGGGSFGTAMAVVLAKNKPTLEVVLLVRSEEVCFSVNSKHENPRVRSVQLPHNVRATVDPREALTDVQYIFHAVPVQSSRIFLTSVAKHISPNVPVVNLSKGVELGTTNLMSQVIRGALSPSQPVVALSGPTFASEIIDEVPSAMVAACSSIHIAKKVQYLLSSSNLRINTSNDIYGVELAGALKNVLAIAAGIVDGLDLGHNAMAALVSQGMSEMNWLAEKMGAKASTLASPAGVGDVMLTCFVNKSRNRTVGLRLGRGESLEEILESMDEVAEGVPTAAAIVALARKYNVKLPVLTAVARILEGELTPKNAVLHLMSLPQISS